MFFINDFSDSRERVIVDFENDLELSTLDEGGRVSTTNLTRWYERGNELKYDELDSYSVVVAWDDAVEFETTQSPDISFELNQAVAAETLILSLSAIDIPTKPTGWEEEDDGEDSDGSPSSHEEESDADDNSPLNWTIELTDSTGITAQLPLSHDSGLYPLIRAIPRRAAFLDSTDPTEVLFRRFEYPLSEFTASSGSFDSSSLSRIRFIFDDSPRGALILDNISVLPAPAL